MTGSKSETTSSSTSSHSTAPPSLQAPSDRSTRPPVAGPSTGPEPPFPIYLSGPVQRGFGRGGKDLGCPTANLPSRLLKPGHEGGGLAEAPTGVYFGWARVISEEEGGRGNEYEDKEVKDKARKDADQKGEDSDTAVEVAERKALSEEDSVVHPMVMSLGWNPFYANKTKTAEVHMMYPFKADFYGLHIKVIVLGYIRPEYNYVSMDALKDDIDTDKVVGERSLQRDAYATFKEDPFFFSSPASRSSSSL